MTILACGLRLLSVAGVVSIVAALGSAGVVSISQREDIQNHHSPLHAQITLVDGADRAVILEGVGCNVSICSRVAIRTTEG